MITNEDAKRLYRNRKVLQRNHDRLQEVIAQSRDELAEIDYQLSIANDVTEIVKGVALKVSSFNGIKTVAEDITRYARVSVNVNGGFNVYTGDDPLGARNEHRAAISSTEKEALLAAKKWVVKGVKPT